MLDLRGITKRYGTQIAIADLDLHIPAGRRTAIVGPSGSGKTTLLRLIAGFEQPDSGTITLDGRVLGSPALSIPPHRRNIGLVAQEGALFPHMSVAGNIGFGLPDDTPNRERRIDELIGLAGLPDGMRNRRPHELSGGQQQRVALARALARQPGLMLLDEPFSALDTGLRDALREAVKTVLGEAGVTTVLVTHDRAEALSFADHLVVMRDGRAVDSGPPQRLYQQPCDPETARFLGEGIILPARIEGDVARTALGDIAVRSGQDGRKTVLIRLEQVTIHPLRDAPIDTGRKGRVVSRSFQGGSWKLVLDVDAAAGEHLVFSVSVPATDTHEPDDFVHIAVQGTAHIFPPPGGSERPHR